MDSQTLFIPWRMLFQHAKLTGDLVHNPVFVDDDMLQGIACKQQTVLHVIYSYICMCACNHSVLVHIYIDPC